MQKKTIEVIVGKIPGDGDKNKPVVKGLRSPAPASTEAGARGSYQYVSCAWCDAINYVYVSDCQYYSYECWCCGNNFIV